MIRISLLTLSVFASAGAASAEATLSISLKSGTSDNVQSQNYSCGKGESFPVQYVNTGANSLAIVSIDGEDRIFVNVVSASGAKYVSGAYVWWTKGDTATLENEMEEGSLTDCRSQDELPSQ